MERYDGEPPTGLQRPFRRRQSPRQFSEFVVDGDAQRLKHPRRRMGLLGRRGWRDSGDEARKLQGRDERRGCPVGDDGAGDAAGGALLAEMKEDVRQLFDARLGENVGGGHAAPFHTHVERGVEAQ